MPIASVRSGCRMARLMSARYGGAVTNSAIITSIAATDRQNGQGVVDATTQRVWGYSATSTATASINVLVPDDAPATGRWIGQVDIASSLARLATVAPLPANTRTGNVLLANANGVIANIDATVPAVGDLVLVKDEVAGANNGLYVVDSIGAAGAPWQMTRCPTRAASEQIRTGLLVAIAAGGANADTLWQLTTDAPITINVTALVFAQAAAAAAALALTTLLASHANAEGASLIGLEDPGNIITATHLEAAVAEVHLKQRTLQVVHGDLTDAVNGHTQVLNIGAALPVGAIVVASELNIATLFSGGAVAAVTVDVGGTNADAIGDGHNVFTGAATGQLTLTPAGVHVVGAFSAEQLTISFTPDGAHALVDLTAGDLTVTVWFLEIA